MKKLQKQLKTAKKIQQLLADNPEMLEQLALSSGNNKKSKTKTRVEDDDDLPSDKTAGKLSGIKVTIKRDTPPRSRRRSRSRSR